MPLRATWKGLLKVSLITIPVRLYNAVSSTAKVSLNQSTANTRIHRCRRSAG